MGLKANFIIGIPRNRMGIFFKLHQIIYIIIVDNLHYTGRAHLIWRRLIWSSTLFDISVKTLPDYYHFMFIMHG